MLRRQLSLPLRVIELTTATVSKKSTEDVAAAVNLRQEKKEERNNDVGRRGVKYLSFKKVRWCDANDYNPSHLTHYNQDSIPTF